MKKFIMDINKLTKKQRYLIFFGLILPVCLSALTYSIYNLYYFEPEYKVNCMGKIYITNNKTIALEQLEFCKKYVLPMYQRNKIVINFNYSLDFNKTI